MLLCVVLTRGQVPPQRSHRTLSALQSPNALLFMYDSEIAFFYLMVVAVVLVLGLLRVLCFNIHTASLLFSQFGQHGFEVILTLEAERASAIFNFCLVVVFVFALCGFGLGFLGQLQFRQLQLGIYSLGKSIFDTCFKISLFLYAFCVNESRFWPQ